VNAMDAVQGMFSIGRPSAISPAYSFCISNAIFGPPLWGVVHSAYTAATNILFPNDFLLSLNACNSTQMPNGIQLATPAGAFPLTQLRPSTPVLLGAGQLIIDAIDFALDLSQCSQWDPRIKRSQTLDMGLVQKNGAWLAQYARTNPRGWFDIYRPVTDISRPMADIYFVGADISRPGAGLGNQAQTLARRLCGRGVGLTPSGDDALAGWMALQWLLHGPEPRVIEACWQILEIAKQQTHLLSQCWLAYAAQGAVAMPVRDLLLALTRDNERELEMAARAVLALGATSGHDLIQGVLLGLEPSN
jgi:hypothetical protein